MSQITKKSAETFGSSVSIEFHISGSLSFDEMISQKTCSNNPELSTYKRDIAKGNKRSSNKLIEYKCSKIITTPRCYSIKDFFTGTALMNNPASHTCSYERPQLAAEKESFHTYKGISDDPRNIKYVADQNQYNRKTKEFKYTNEVQLYYVFDKPFQRQSVPKTEQKNVDCYACCQTDNKKNTSGVIKRFYQKLLEPNEGKDAVQATPCGNPSIFCQVDGMQNKGSDFRSRKPTLLDPNEYKKEAHQTELCCNTSVLCQADDINNDDSFFKRRRLEKINIPQDGAEKCANPSTHCQAGGGIKNKNSVFKKFFSKIVEPVECKCVTNKISQINLKAPKPVYTCAEVTTQSRRYKNETKKNFFSKILEPVECKCVTNKLSQINIKAPKLVCTCAEVETQSRRYKNETKLNFYKNHNSNKLQTSEVISPVTQKSANSSTLCNLNSPKKEDNTLQRLFHILIATKPECTCAEAKTQSRKYEGSYQRAGRESFYRDIGTSGFPKYTKTPESQEMPIEEMEYTNDDDLYCVCDKPATMNRRVGPNGGYNMKCCHNMPQDTQKFTNSSAFCRIDCTRNDGGAFKRLFQKYLEPKRVSQVKQEPVNSSILCQLDGINNEIDVYDNMHQYAPSCTNSYSLCQIDGEKNNRNTGAIKKLFHMILVAKNIMPQKSSKNRGTLCQVGGIKCEYNAIKRLLQMLIEPNNSKDKANKLKETNPSITVYTEAKTQSRKYGGQQQRAGKEIFRKNRGTSGVPKQRCKKLKNEEEPVYEVIEENEEETGVEPVCKWSNKEIGIGTNCNFTFGWFKDRLAYGEPKPQDTCNNTTKIAIEQWNKAPLKKVRKVSTKIGATLKTNSTCNIFNTTTGTQSRKYRNRDLRAGREVFRKERQTSCVPKCKKPPIDGNNVCVNPVQPPAPDRKALRLGSDCSFCFEFYRDMPPESPDNAVSKVDEPQVNTCVISKLFRHRRAIGGNEIKTGVRGTDASTSTEALEDSTKQKQKETSNTKSAVDSKDKNETIKEECRCENIKKKPLKTPDRPLHIGSTVKFNFNFFKSISPPKGTNHVLIDDTAMKEKCSCGVITNESGVTTTREVTVENKQNASATSECDPNICITSKTDDVNSNESPPPQEDFDKKTFKTCFLEFMSKNNFKRLLLGTENKPKVKEQTSQNFRSRRKPVIDCEAKCKSMGKEPPEADKPFRIGSSFSFGYDIKNVVPKHKDQMYEETFPEPKDFSGSKLKTDLTRLIMGKIRKRKIVKPKVRFTRTLEQTVCDPQVCKKRKEMNKTWFTYILDNIRHPKETDDTETTNFFKKILSGVATTTNKCCRQPTCCKRKQKDYGWFTCVLSNIKKEKKSTDPDDAERFFKRMLEETDDIKSCECRRRRRRRRRKQMPYGQYRAQFSAPNKPVDMDLSDWTPRSRSETPKEKTPCRVRSECCFNCDYNKLDDSDTESTSTHSDSDSMNFATT